MIWTTRWKQIEGFPDYYVSDDGRVFSMKRMKVMNLFEKHGQKYVKMTNNYQQYQRNVDNLRRAAFRGE